VIGLSDGAARTADTDSRPFRGRGAATGNDRSSTGPWVTKGRSSVGQDNESCRYSTSAGTAPSTSDTGHYAPNEVRRSCAAEMYTSEHKCATSGGSRGNRAMHPPPAHSNVWPVNIYCHNLNNIIRAIIMR